MDVPAAWIGGVRAADCLRERGQPDAGEVDGAGARRRRARGARRFALATGARHARREPRAVRGRHAARCRGRLLGHRDHACRSTGDAASPQGRRTRPAGARHVGARGGGDGHRLWPAAGAEVLAAATGQRTARGRTDRRRRDTRERVRGVLLVAEVALAVVLLVGSALFVSSFVKLTRVDLGLDYENVLTMRVNPKVNFSSPERDKEMARAAILIEDVFARVRRIPGVEHAAFLGNGSVPLSAGWSRTSFEIAGGAKFEDPDDQPDIKSVSADYFKTLRVAVQQGREFTEADRDSGAPAVAIINDIAAQRFFKGESPIGRQVKVNGDRTIVGVVRAVRLGGPEADMRPEVITPASRTSAFGGTLILRTSGDPAAIMPDVRAAVRAVLPDVVVPEAETMETMFGRLVAQRKFNMIVLALFGVLAIVISAVGIYGVMAYLVEQRTQEIGIRMALGAQPRQVLRMVLRRAALFMATGILIGLAAGWMLSRFVESFLFRVEPHDVLVYVGAASVLIAAGLLAAFIPARRAARVNPLLVLR